MFLRVLTLALASILVSTGARSQAPAAIGTEEFGLTARELHDRIERAEALISRCMREEGFRYIAVDYLTIRKGMSADKNIPGMSEEDFIGQYGFGVSTLYTGKPPQLTEGYSPGRVGLGEQNVALYKNLSPADQVAYTRALFGATGGTTLAMAIETENLSRAGGCTRHAIEQVFEPERLKASYYNPNDVIVNNDPRMKDALEHYAAEMRDAGFNYNHPDEVEPDIRERLAALTDGGTLLLEEMTPAQRAALQELQDYERRVATKSFELEEEIFDPVEAQIEREMHPREVK